MRIAIAAFAFAALAGPAMSQARANRTPAAPTLAQIGADNLASRRPVSVEAAPPIIALNPDLAAALRAEPIDGGRERTLYLALADGRLSLARSIVGSRYRATGTCLDCDFVQPIRGHTHPYENPFSVVDLRIAASEGRPSLMVTTAGQIWLALPTGATRPPAPDIAERFALFGNRLECGVETPADGWAAPSAMGRRVEVIARVAADQLGLALYVADPGQDFRKLAPVPTDIEAVAPKGIVHAAELNTYERSLLRLLLRAGQTPAGQTVAWTPPTEPYPALDRALSAPARYGVLRMAAFIAAGAESQWFSALPTTVYVEGFADLDKDELPFVAVQNSADCSRVLVMEGRQTFAPDTVRHSRGWWRDRTSTAPIEQSWTEMAGADFPTGQVVPW